MELILDGIKKKFETKEVLKDISFEFKKGLIYGLLGRNGAGKTTLFNCLAGELKPDSGKTILRTDKGESPLKVDHIGYVFSTAVLPEFLTGYEFIRFYMDINHKDIKSSMSVDDYFDMIKIDGVDRNKLIKSYSLGMKNKIQMLLFIISKPPIILLDEPLTSLDVVVALEMKKLLLEMRKDHIIIFSTHIMQLAADLCDEIVVISGGKLDMLDRNMLQDKNFEEKLITVLGED